MAILIKGMKTPAACEFCPLGIYMVASDIRTCQCKITNDIRPLLASGRIDSCPLVEVPPHGDLVEWIPFESRPMDDEERKYYSEMTGFDMSDDAVIYRSKLPEDGQEVLICDKYGNVWQDIFCNDPEYGVGLETHGDMDGIVAWMPMPEPYKPEEET